MQPRKTSDMEFVDHRLRERPAARHRSWRRRLSNDDAKRHGSEGVRGIGDVVRFPGVVQNRARVVNAAGNRPGVRINEQLGWVEASPCWGHPSTMNPEAVALLNTHALDEDRPYSIVGAGHVVVGLVAVLIDQSELNPCRPWRPEPE